MALGVLVALIATSFVILQPGLAIDEALSPIFSPFMNDICDAIECGKGTCNATSNLTFICQCDHGWRQALIGDDFKFLPCVIPNCTLNLDCNKASAPVQAQAAAAAPAPAHAHVNYPIFNHSIFDPCRWSYCGEGTCVRTSAFGHRCNCTTGYTNLLNVTNSPCFSACALGLDCTKLGVGVTNRSSSGPSLSDSDGSALNHGSLCRPRNLLWSIVFIITVAIAAWI